MKRSERKLKMLKLLKKSKKLWISSLVVLVVGCSSKAPKPPVVDFGMHDVSTGIMLCARSNGAGCPSKPMSQTDGYIMFSPQDYQKVQNYIDTLICQVDGGCGGTMQIQSSDLDPVEEARLFSQRMKKVYGTLRWKKKELKGGK
jgi:hypothetical protein